jgi:hypothetical protein
VSFETLLIKSLEIQKADTCIKLKTKRVGNYISSLEEGEKSN